MGIRADILSRAEPVYPVLTVRDSDTVAEPARLMQRHCVGSLVVVDEAGDVVEIVTERDIIVGCTAQAKAPDKVPVVDIMTKDVVSVRPGTPVNVADELMAAHGIRHLPVVDNGKAVGMISARDVMTARLGIVQAMKDAAEQIALLSKNVRKLDLQEILDRLAGDVPKVFGANRWALYLASEDHSSDAEPLIHRINCPCSVETLAERTRDLGPAGDESPAPAGLPDACQRLGATGCHALVSLSLPEPSGAGVCHREGGSSYLCMCGLPQVTEASAEVLRYKLALVADILTMNFANARLYKAAYRDPLTGLRARRALEEAIEAEYSRGLRYDRTFCVAMLDVDDFKSINDTHGHATGDAVLKQLGETLGAGVRAHDVAARYGGDEMAVLMPETELDGALVVIERLRCRLERKHCVPGGRPVTVSCGLAEWSGLLDETGAAVIRRADEALYEAKRAGRNCVVTARPGNQTCAVGSGQPV